MNYLLEQVKALMTAWLGPLYPPVNHLAHVLFPFTDATIFNGIFVGSAIVLALGFYVFSADRKEQSTVNGFLRFLAPRDVFLHPSALVDYRFYLVNSMFLSYARLSTRVAGLVGLFHVAALVESNLSGWLGDGRLGVTPDLPAKVGYTLAIVLAVDFAHFLAHFIQHKVPLLWEFHKVHHSAEVLTPVTIYRQHPADILLEQFLSAILVGVVVGVFACWYEGEVLGLTIMNIGAVHFLYFLSANLRHSHIPLSFGPRVSLILSSPAMHQIHHSSEVRHWNRNFALIFSFWDAIFRSLYIPRGKESFRLGLPGDESRRFGSVLALYLAPFAGVARSVARRRPTGASDGSA